MKIRAGKYTLALTLVAAGIMILVNTFYGLNTFDNFWVLGAAVLIVFGLEVVVLSIVYSKRQDYRVEVSTGSIILIILLFIFFMAWTNKVEIRGPFFDDLSFGIRF